MILEKETYEKFGYYPSDLKLQSHKKILAACDLCGKVRVIPRYAYRTLCISCVRKGEKSHLWNGGLTKQKCEVCGSEFYTKPSQIKKGWGRFCSRLCQSKGQKGEKSPKWNGGLVKQKCEVCGKEFEVESSKIKRGQGRFCSKICARKKQVFQKHHTKPELIFEEICNEHNIPFHYVGDGQLWIGKKGEKQLNPDFIEANGKKICVEIMGDYWHSPLFNRNLKECAVLSYREKYYKRYKWHPVFIWERDLKREDAEVFVMNLLSKEGVIAERVREEAEEQASVISEEFAPGEEEI